MDFPHLPDTSFPGIENVDPYKAAPVIDYPAEYDDMQMELLICSVPWDMGEAHVGQRTIEGVGNVVWFGSESNRNAYFDTMQDGDGCKRYATKYKSFHGDMTIRVPVPFEQMGNYNYIEVTYPQGDEPLVGTEPLKRWYYFIRQFDRDANDTTLCTLILDVWQTMTYRMDVQALFLDQGHWPVAHSSVDDYLADPVDNSEYLLTPDVSFGEIGRAKATSAAVVNDDVRACIVTTGDPGASWGAVGGSDWRAPVAPSRLTQGATGPCCIMCAPGDLAALLSNANAQAPQFFQTVQGVFFAPSKLVTAGATLTLFGVACNYVVPGTAEIPVIDLAKSQFGYADRYAELAKLYTYPYAALDVYAEDGSATRVTIEDTSGALTLTAALQITWPWVSIDSRLSGLGGSGASGSITFANAEAHAFQYMGLWYQKLIRWDVPVYEVVQSAESANFATYWDRQQTMKAAANTQDNAEASANLQVTNTAVQTQANAAINARSNQAAITDSSYGNGINQALQAWNAGASRSATAIEVEGQQLQAAVGAAAGVIGSVASGAMSGGGIGALGGLISGAISGGASMANTAISANMSESKTESQIYYQQQQVNETNQNNTDKINNQVSANTDNTATKTQADTTAAANSAAVAIANSARDYSTSASAVANQVNLR